MARIPTIRPRLAKLAPRIGYAPGDEVARSRHRDATQPWRSWYKTERWQKLRQVILTRDLFKCQCTGVLLIGRHPDPNSPVVDHIRPHRGDERLFWDPSNLMAVSKAYHDGEKQRLERREI